MSTSVNALLGVVFLGLGFATTFTMYRFWGYPYDKETRTSECPQWKMNVHRVLGIAYALIYIVLMCQMVPRLLSYQVEFPPRTVAHIVFGLSIGVVLMVKLSILRFFRHFEEWMPVLGTLLLLFTVVLSGLSLPFVLEERVLASAAAGDDTMSRTSRERAAHQLERIDFGRDVDLVALTTRESMLAGREVLLTKCVYCHDLKTAIAKPKTAPDWWRIVERMAAKPNLGPPLTAEDELVVTAYLIAITPELQHSAADKQKRAEEAQRTAAMLDDTSAAEVADAGVAAAATPAYDAKLAKEEFDDLCSQCHDASDVDDDPPASRADARDLLKRMIEHGLEADEDQLVRLEEYMVRAYATAP